MARGSAVAPFVDFTGAFVYELAEALQVEAAVQGFRVTNSTMTVNGIPLKCVSLTGKVKGQVGAYEWCVTADGVLGLAKYTGGTAGDGSSFEITKLDTSPPGFSLRATPRCQFYDPHDPDHLRRGDGWPGTMAPLLAFC